MTNKSPKKNSNFSFDIREQWPTVLLLMLLAAELIFIIWINFFHISDTIDEDFSGMLTHTLEIARQKKLLLPNWFYPTTGEFDTSLFLAVPFFWITGNIYSSFAIVNILNAILIGYVFYRILSLAGCRREYAIMGMCMAIAAYDFGMLDYSNMLFFGGSQYVYKAVLPLLFMALLFSGKDLSAGRFMTGKSQSGSSAGTQKAGKSQAGSSSGSQKVGKGQSGSKGVPVLFVVDCCLFYSLFFLTSFSSGIYVFLCGIIPILVSCFVIVVTRDALDKKPLFIHFGAATLVALVGVILHKMNNLEIHSFNDNLMKLRHETTFSEAFNEVLDSFVSVIDPVTKSPVDATSVIGMIGAMKWLMLFMICLGLLFLPRVFGFDLIKNVGEKPSVRKIISTCCISVFAFNYFVLLITVSKSRYHLIGFFGLMVCAVIFLEDYFRHNRILEKIFLLAVTGMYACLVLANVTYHAPRYFAHEGVVSYYLDEEFCGRIKECADNYGVSTVFFVNVIEDAEIMRLYDNSRKYETYIGKTAQVYNYDSYITDIDKSRLDGRNIMAVSEEGLLSLRDYVKDGYEKIDHIGRYDIMISDHSPMDGGSLIFKGDKTIDLPVSPGYDYEGDVSVQGYLFSTGEGEIMRSSEIEAEIPFAYTLNYDFEGAGGTSDGADGGDVSEADAGADVSGADAGADVSGAGAGADVSEAGAVVDAAVLEVYQNGSVIKSVALDPGEHSVSFDLVSGAPYTFVVNKTGSGVITIKEIEFEGK